MKELFFTIVLLFLVQILQAKVYVEVSKTTFDENFIPTYTIKVSNTDSKTVSNVVVIFDFLYKGFSEKYESNYEHFERNLKVKVKPNGTKFVDVTIEIPDRCEFHGIKLDKVRYTDGSGKIY